MNVACIGGGPAGLYFGLLAKKANPGSRIRVLERNRPFDTFGWGVVFSDQTLENLRRADAPTHDEIVASFAHWDDIEIHFQGRTLVSGGHGFSGIARKRLLNILQRRAQDVGVELVFEKDVKDLAEVGDCDLVVVSDGINSRIRTVLADWFEPDVQAGKCRFVWLGTRLALDAFTFFFERTEHGWFTVHAYRFDERSSTFIVECREETWRAHGLDRADTAQTLAFCEQLFAKYLQGHELAANSPHLRGNDWTKFTRVRNRRWVGGNVVLVGDAAHSAHFSVGSGTKLAMEDAIALQLALAGEVSQEAALHRYEEERQTAALRLQNAARNSAEWFENVERYATLPPEQFAYSLLTRSQRISHENLRLRDREYIGGVERWFAGGDRPVPPMFAPFALRGMQLRNRVVVSPMDVYSATDGYPNDFHLIHLGSRAVGGAGLVYTEMACVSPEGRITPRCTGMYEAGHVGAWRRIVRAVHEWSGAKMCLQLGHSGPKGSTKLMWEGMDEPLESGNWVPIGPSALPYGPRNQVPRAMTRQDMVEVLRQFERAARWAIDAEFDMLEVHCAHGYLLSSFITPLQNARDDEYGGSLENRLRFPLEVFAAVRSVWPQERPLSVRISATDWHPAGIGDDEAVAIARAFKAVGCDLIDVSSGQTSRDSTPVYGRMFQTPYADRIRNEAGIATMAVGNIFEADHVNSIVAAGRADLVALGRPHLADPYWTLHAAAQLGYEAAEWPVQYLPGKAQLDRNLFRAAQPASDLLS